MSERSDWFAIRQGGDIERSGFTLHHDRDYNYKYKALCIKQELWLHGKQRLNWHAANVSDKRFGFTAK